MWSEDTKELTPYGAQLRDEKAHVHANLLMITFSIVKLQIQVGLIFKNF